MTEHPKLPQPKQAFIIYDPKTEKYSRGGMTPTWSKKPKMWSGWGPLKNHLAMFISVEYLDRGNRYLNAKRKHSIAHRQPYSEDCIIFDIVANGQVAKVHDIYKEMIYARVEQDKKDQDKRIADAIMQIRKMNGQEI